MQAVPSAAPCLDFTYVHTQALCDMQASSQAQGSAVEAHDQEKRALYGITGGLSRVPVVSSDVPPSHLKQRCPTICVINLYVFQLEVRSLSTTEQGSFGSQRSHLGNVFKYPSELCRCL